MAALLEVYRTEMSGAHADLQLDAQIEALLQNEVPVGENLPFLSEKQQNKIGKFRLEMNQNIIGS